MPPRLTARSSLAQRIARLQWERDTCHELIFDLLTIAQEREAQLVTLEGEREEHRQRDQEIKAGEPYIGKVTRSEVA